MSSETVTPVPIVLSLGSVNADFQLRVDRSPAVGETLPGTDFVRLGGGKAANVAYLCRRLDHGAKLLARVGDDDLRAQALAPLRAAGVDLSAVSTDGNAETGVAMIVVPPNGKKGIFLAANANDTWTESEARTATAAIADAPGGSVLVVDCEVPGFVVEQALEAACAREMPAILDPSPADRVSATMLSKAKVITPNASEAARLTGISADGPMAATLIAQRLAERGVQTVCLKLADGGCIVWHDGTLTRIPSMPISVVDTTGAGDAFAGALAVAFAERRPPITAAAFAVAASHLAVSGYGSQPAYPTRAQIEEMVPALVERAHPLERH